MIKNEVLLHLEKRKGNLVTGGQLAKVLKVSRNSIWKAIRSLQEDGNEIISIPNKGYKLLDTNDTLSEALISEGLATSFVGRKMILLPTIHSTNNYLKELDTTDDDSGLVVISNEQTSGRGRRSRTFLSPKSEGIYLSILLKVNNSRQDIRLLTICTAVAISKAIEKKCTIRADIKWVNDIFCNGKKICGILTEAILSGELQELSSIIIGIGINTGTIPPELNDIATSIEEVAGIRGIRNELITEVLNLFEMVYLDYTEREKRQEIMEYYKSRLFIIGKQILVSGVGTSYVATVLGVDDMGGLIVKDDCERTQHITSGEIELNWENHL